MSHNLVKSIQFSSPVFFRGTQNRAETDGGLGTSAEIFLEKRLARLVNRGTEETFVPFENVVSWRDFPSETERDEAARKLGLLKAPIPPPPKAKK